MIINIQTSDGVVRGSNIEWFPFGTGVLFANVFGLDACQEIELDHWLTLGARAPERCPAWLAPSCAARLESAAGPLNENAPHG
jgi:hypothetical protein